MNAPPTPEPPVDPKKLEVTQPAPGSLVRLLAWMLVLVLVSFVGVSGWFLYRVQELRQQYEGYDYANIKSGGLGPIDPPEFEATRSNLLTLYAHAESLEAVQHALDQGDIEKAS